jgi:hypothetical protein
MDKIGLEKRMIELDNVVNDLYPEQKFRCVIVGGGALLIHDLISRVTIDVDALSVSKEVEELFASFDFNTRVKTMIHCFPYHYEDRLELIDIETKCIQFYTPCIEDLIVSKLYAYRGKDVEDLTEIKKSGKYNPILLDEVILEAKYSALNERTYTEMLSFYKRFFKE